MVVTRAAVGAEARAEPYNLRKRKSDALVAKAHIAQMQVALAADTRTLKYQTGMKPIEFLKKLQEDNPEFQILDVKDMSRAPLNVEIKKALLEKVKGARGIRMTLTGEKSQEHGMLLLKTCENLNFLEIVLPKIASVAFQKELMNFLLEIPNLKTLLLFGSFKCVTEVGAPMKDASIATLRCPGEARARNNFIKTLIQANESTLMMLDFGEDPLPETIQLASGCSNLMCLKVNSFSDLRYLETLPKVVQVLVQGCQESVDSAVNTILNYQSSSLLARIQFLGLYANPQEKERMHHVLLALAGMCRRLVALQLIGWSGQANLHGTLRTMPGLTRLSLKNCQNINVCLLEDIACGESLPHLRGFHVENTTWSRSADEVNKILSDISESRPSVSIMTMDQNSE